MEGSGVVAVVHGLRDAGLTVTLLSRRYLEPSGYVPQGTSSQIQATRPAVDIGTETAAPFPSRDVEYMSNYQMTYCRSSTSSPVRLPQYSSQGFHQFRSSISRTPDEEAFVESLRKYPNMSPIRSRSAELIERMLLFTQNKNGTNSRSAKSLPTKEPFQYSHGQLDEIPTRDSGISPYDKIAKSNFGFKRDVELMPASSSRKKTKHENDTGMYDYLNNDRKDKKLKDSEVRYLTNVKQCLKERLRKVCDENPTICPHLQNRYNQHRKQHHKSETRKCHCGGSPVKVSPPVDEEGGPSTSRKSSIEKPFMQHKACFCNQPLPCDCPPQPSRSILKTKPTSDIDMNKHRPCMARRLACPELCMMNRDERKNNIEEAVMAWARDIPVFANFSKEDSLRREEAIDQLIETLGNLPTDERFMESAEQEIRKCLEMLPMWRPESKHDRELFENQMVDSLLQRLKSPKGGFGDEISRWTERIPFIRNADDKRKLVDDLQRNLNSIAMRRPSNDEEYKRTLKNEVVRTLKEFSTGTDDVETADINDLADDLVEKLVKLPVNQQFLSLPKNLENVVLDWVKDIPKFSSKINLDNEDKLVNDLISKLNNLQNEDIDSGREQTRHEIENWLNSVEEKKQCQIDQQTKNLLANQLMNKILDLDRYDANTQNLGDIVSKWLQDNTDALGVDLLDHKSDIDVLISKLKELEGIQNKENRQNSMRKEILDWLQDLGEKSGRSMDSRTQENLVNNLLGMINDKTKQATKKLDTDLVTQKIWEWVDSQKGLAQDRVKSKNMVTELSNRLQNLMAEKGEISENDVRDEVTKWLDKISNEIITKIDTDNRKILENQLLSCIKPSKRRKSWAKPESVTDKVTREVANVLDELDKPLQLKENDKEIIKDQIVKVLTGDLNALNSSQVGNIIPKVAKILKQKTAMSDKEVDEITRDLIERVKEAMKSNLDTTGLAQRGPISLEKRTKEKLRSKVANVFQKKPARNKSEVIDKITDTLAKYHLDVNEDVNKTILDTLKNAEISDTEVDNIMRELLNITNQLRSELTASGVDSSYTSPRHGSVESLQAQKQIFMQRLEREITDFMEKILSESSSLSRDRDTSAEIKLPSHSKNYSVYENIDLKNPPFKTSTPKRGSLQNEEGKPGDSTLTDESEYKAKIKGIIRKWISSLNVNGAIGDTFKDDMANDLANDIIDREMYMQLSKQKRSSQEELEHLKYQIFKWTNKLPNLPDLTANASKIKELMKSLEGAQIDNSSKRSNLGTITESDTNLSQKENIVPTQEKIYGAVSNWLDEQPKLKPRNAQDKRTKENVMKDLAQRLKEILSFDANKQAINMEDMCKEEIVKSLKKMNVKGTDDELKNTADELMNHLKAQPPLANILERNEKVVSGNLRKKDAIKQAVHNWCQKLPLQRGVEYEDMKETVDKLADAITRYVLVTDAENVDALMSDILDNLKQLPIQTNKEGYKNLPEFTENLIGTLKEVLNDSYKYSASTEDTLVPKPTHKKAADLMYGNIQDWCEKLPLKFGSAQEDIERANMIKQNVQAKLLKKIGELNLDPEIFHDDVLYENVLKDEIEKILDELPKTSELEAILPTIKENLVKNIMEAKEAMNTEMAGYAYKQQLRDAISKTLSSIGLPVTNDTSFEALKENLADAFISLHYVADDTELKNKFKEKIFNEINKFCNDYLKRHPSSPLDAKQINQELYQALKKVPMPKDESLRREVEHIRMKDLVSDWFKDLPLKETLPHDQETKIKSILAKKIHEIEKEAELNQSFDTDAMIKNEISKWLNKFNLNLKEIDNETAAQRLVSKLNATKDSRRIDETARRKSLNFADLTSDLEETTNGRHRCPASCLNADDLAHLQRIRERASSERTYFRPDDRKDASVSPAPIAEGIQTEERQTNNFIFQKVSQNASIQTILRDTEPPAPITPQVIIKEYYWDTTRSQPIQSRGSIFSGTGSPVMQAEGIRQEAKMKSSGNTHTAAAQTLPHPSVVKATITQEASLGFVSSPHVADHVEATTQNPCLKRRQNQDVLTPSTVAVEFPSELSGKRDTPKGPCRGRAEIPRNPEVGSSKTIRENVGARELPKCRPDCRSRLYEEEYRENESPCFRRRIYQTPDHESCKRKKKEKCSCGSHGIRCTIRPRPMPCPQSNKSCSALANHCPRCWEGFCPHPSYLYFRRD